MGKKNKAKYRKRFQVLNTTIKGDEVTDEPGVVKIDLFFDMVNGQSKVINAVTKEVMETDGMELGYIGETKWRTTARIKSDPDDHSYCLRLKQERYKHLLAIDTNTLVMAEPLFAKPRKVSIGAAVVYSAEEAGSKLLSINRPFIASFDSPKPENENWMQLIKLLEKSCACEDSRPVGIVVDSDLGNLDDYNSRSKPIFENYFLPDGYELIFASDKVKDNLFNEMIHRCHFLAGKLIQRLKEQKEWQL